MSWSPSFLRQQSEPFDAMLALAWRQQKHRLVIYRFWLGTLLLRDRNFHYNTWHDPNSVSSIQYVKCCSRPSGTSYTHFVLTAQRMDAFRDYMCNEHTNLTHTSSHCATTLIELAIITRVEGDIILTWCRLYQMGYDEAELERFNPRVVSENKICGKYL